MTELLAQLRRKDKGAIAALYQRYGKKLYGYAVSKWRVDEDEAWELVYKTLYKIIEVAGRYTFENESKFNGFVFQVFINYLRNHYNSKKGKGLDTVAFSQQLENILSEKKEADHERPDTPYMSCLKKILEQFDDWKRILLLMKAQDFSYEEIASYVSKPAGQLKVYYMRARKALTEKVNDCVENA